MNYKSIVFLSFIVAFMSLAFGRGIQKFPADEFQIGHPSSTEPKKYKIKTNNASYPSQEVGVDPSNPNTVYASADELKVGSNPSTDKSVVYEKGLGSSNPKITYNSSASKFQMENAGLGLGVLHSSSVGVFTSSLVDLVNDITGTLLATNGGTGKSSWTTMAIPFISGPNTFAEDAASLSYSSSLNKLSAANFRISSLTTGIAHVGVSGDVTSNAVDLSSADVTNSLPVNKIAAQTASRAAVYDGSGFLTSSATTATEIGYSSGLTGNIQDQIDNIVATSGAITQLTDDVTAGPGSGSVSATVAFVGGQPAADVASATTQVEAATTASTPDTIVKRTSNGAIHPDTVSMPNAGDLLTRNSLNELVAIPHPDVVSQVLTTTTNNGYVWQTPASGGSSAATWLVDAYIYSTSGNQTVSTSSTDTWSTLTNANLVLVNNNAAIGGSAPISGVEIACASGTASTGTTCSSNENYGIAFTVPTACYLEVCADMHDQVLYSSGAAAALVGTNVWSIQETSNTSTTPTVDSGSRSSETWNMIRDASFTQGVHFSRRVCGQFRNATASTKKTYRLFYQNEFITGAASDWILYLDEQASLGGTVSDRNIHWTAHCIAQ